MRRFRHYYAMPVPAPAIAPRLRLSADVIRDVCARPALLLAIGQSLPTAAIVSEGERGLAVADGVARALELAALLEGGGTVGARDRILLAEAEDRLWEPTDASFVQVLQRTGPDGLFAALVVQGAARREAWRRDTQRRRAEPLEQLTEHTVGAAPEPLDVAVFRAEVEQLAEVTARRTGLTRDVALGLLADELSFAEAGRQSGRSANSIWMAVARLRPDWREVAARGRAAGLGGGLLVDLTERGDRAVGRLVRWRVVGGVTAALLLAAASGALLMASLVDPASAPRLASARVDLQEAVAPALEDPVSDVGRLLALEVARRLLSERGSRPAAAAAGSTRRPTQGSDEVQAQPTVAAVAAEGAASARSAGRSCGLGSASLTCR